MYAPTVNQATTRSPVKLEGAVAVGNRSAVEVKGLLSGLGAGKLDEAVTGVAVGQVKSVYSSDMTRDDDQVRIAEVLTQSCDRE